VDSPARCRAVLRLRVVAAGRKRHYNHIQLSDWNNADRQIIWIMDRSLRLSLAKVVFRFLGEIHRHDAGHILPLLHAAKLTTPQLAVLEFVFEPCTISTVASYVGLSRPATSQMIHKLVRRGLLRRSEGAADRREKNVVLTARGMALLETIAAARTARFARSISILPARTATRLKAAVSDAVRHMDKAGLAQGRRKRLG
jgi:DNA-binding MarR family transcriptional regulator